jgi:hypothetical protein
LSEWAEHSPDQRIEEEKQKKERKKEERNLSFGKP